MSDHQARPGDPADGSRQVLADAPREAPQRIVVIGAGFSGFFAARRLARTLKPTQATITLVADADGLVYQPLLPEVAIGNLDPRTIVVPLSTTLKRAHLVRGQATRIDPRAKTVSVQTHSGAERQVEYDRLLITAGSVSRLPDIPGLSEHAIGFKTVAQALYLRDLVLLRLERANDEPDPDARTALLSFIVVGAGYAGTELVAQMARVTDRLAKRLPGIAAGELKWTLLDMAPQVMPELGDTPSATVPCASCESAAWTCGCRPASTA